MMMEAGKKDEGSALYVTMKFSDDILGHLSQNHFLHKNPSIVYHVSPKMKSVEDVIKGVREKFAIPCNMKIMMDNDEETLLLPDLPTSVFTHVSNSVRIEAVEDDADEKSGEGDAIEPKLNLAELPATKEVRWDLVAYEDVTPNNIINLKVAVAGRVFYGLVNVVEVREDRIIGRIVFGMKEIVALKADIVEIKRARGT